MRCGISVSTFLLCKYSCTTKNWNPLKKTFFYDVIDCWILLKITIIATVKWTNRSFFIFFSTENSAHILITAIEKFQAMLEWKKNIFCFKWIYCQKRGFVMVYFPCKTRLEYSMCGLMYMCGVYWYWTHTDFRSIYKKSGHIRLMLV